MNTYLETLEFSTILEKLQEHAVSDRAKAIVGALTPSLSEAACVQKMAETTAARGVLDACGSPPLAMMKNLDEILTLSQIGAMLVPEQLNHVAQFATACRRMTAYLLRGGVQNAEMAYYGRSLIPLAELQTDIEARVGEDGVLDHASPELHNLRRKKEYLEAKIKEKLNQILQSRKQYLADGYITTRNGHYVLPVQRRYQNQFGGTVIDTSATGNTVFMEPGAVAELQAEIGILVIEEDAEVRRILYTLSAQVAQHAETVHRNMEVMETLDVLFAKAKLSAAMKAAPSKLVGNADW